MGLTLEAADEFWSEVNLLVFSLKRIEMMGVLIPLIKCDIDMKVTFKSILSPDLDFFWIMN